MRYYKTKSGVVCTAGHIADATEITEEEYRALAPNDNINMGRMAPENKLTKKFDISYNEIAQQWMEFQLSKVTDAEEIPDKLGYIKVQHFDPERMFRWYEYEEDPEFDGVGTYEFPIEYYDGVELILNAFYRKDGKIYVWMHEWVDWEGD